MYKKVLTQRFRDKKICLLGFGREGESSHQLLSSILPQTNIGIADQKLDKNYLKTLTDYDVIFRSPGVPPSLVKQFARPDSLITSQTQVFFEFCPGTIIGVTGTKGKSTTASLIYHVLSSRFPDVRLIGNIGSPPLDSLESKPTADTIFVFELSSHQLSDLNQSPHIAILLNLYPEHLDYYSSFDEYATAKANITRYQTATDILIYNAADPTVVKIARASLAQKYPFEPHPDSELPFIPVAIIVGRLFKIPAATIHRRLNTFTTLPHRLELVGTFKGITFINDSLATIPQATIHAINVTGDKLATLITGGYDRGVDYSPLSQTIASTDLKTLILLPTTGEKIKQGLVDPGLNINIISVNSLAAAVRAAFQSTPPGKICLLSPASASFNLFRDYQHRGDEFRRLVTQLGMTKS